MGHFVVASTDWTKNNIKMAKNGMLYDPMLWLCITFAWPWKKTIRINEKSQQQKNQIYRNCRTYGSSKTL
jgi:hypothetical protein